MSPTSASNPAAQTKYAKAEDVNYLLSLQVLLDLCASTENPASTWLRSAPASSLRLSVLTVSLARTQVRSAGGGTEVERIRARLDDLLSKLQADGGEPLPVGTGATAVWESFIHEPELKGMLQLDRLLYAVAFSEGLCIVEYDHPHSAALALLGVKTQSLGNLD
jgi:hypothetical protein